MPGDPAAPALSVVLPVLNESRDLPTLLDQLLSQRPVRGGYELLVADGGSTDGTRELVLERERRGEPVRLVDNPGRRSSAGRNAGTRAARGRYVLFLDGHCSIPRDDLLARVVELFEETGAACLSRPQPLDRLHEGGWAEAISAARHSWFGHNAGSDIYGCEPGPCDPRSAGAAYPREVIEELGYYDEAFDACEDVEFNHRVHATGRLAYAHPDLAVHYRPRGDLGGLFRQMRRYGRGRARLMAKHPTVRPLPLLALSVAAVSPVVVGLLRGPWAASAWLGAGLLLWLAVAGVEGLRASGPSARALRMVVAFAAVHAGLLLGFWRGLSEYPRYRRRGKEPVRWTR